MCTVLRWAHCSYDSEQTEFTTGITTGITTLPCIIFLKIHSLSSLVRIPQSYSSCRHPALYRVAGRSKTDGDRVKWLLGPGLPVLAKWLANTQYTNRVKHVKITEAESKDMPEALQGTLEWWNEKVLPKSMWIIMSGGVTDFPELDYDSWLGCRKEKKRDNTSSTYGKMTLSS